MNRNDQTMIFAHRGSAGTHPENTMPAFEAGLEAGAEGLECDVQLTKDLVPVVIHDETVNRTTNGQGWIKDLTYEEIKRLDAGSWFSPNFAGVPIPTLEQLFEWAAGTPLILNVELKNGIVRYPGIEKIVLGLIYAYGLEDRTIISSFNHYSLVEVRRQDPDIETAVLFMEGLYEPWNYAGNIKANGLHCFFPAAVPELLEGARNANMPVRPFTVNEEGTMQNLIKGGCAGIITDWPEKAVHARNSIGN
ncbi:glycerophosphodiester phosphodiesterase [Salipaludibacillus sp. CUR1]|uniref:glycerophosphodiester phosphodiesterase n=1 Tax=Salipaludibacillus sp. CUR1 TaxID=2820003 RepID=UPI001E5ADA0D|nr:glycerophosphodiester phosphodiesterase [Salipaludibacillus sp. CUR1]MCE7790958.1 glycerophosphodiester phosphodiesterase [Salipaludibacillus sp. CUR1]